MKPPYHDSSSRRMCVVGPTVTVVHDVRGWCELLYPGQLDSSVILSVTVSLEYWRASGPEGVAALFARPADLAEALTDAADDPDDGGDLPPLGDIAAARAARRERTR